MTCGIEGGEPIINYTCTEMTCEHDACCGDFAECSDGDIGDGYTCSCMEGADGESASNTGHITCVERSCNAFYLSSVDGVSNSHEDSNACVDGIVLTAIDSPSCT